MKKRLSLLLVLSMMCTAVLAGCGGKEQEPQTIDDVQENTEEEAKGEAAGAQEMTFVLSKSRILSTRRLRTIHSRPRFWLTVLKDL